MEALQINTENALKAYYDADNNGKLLLQNLFGKAIFSKKITDWFESFEDGCALTGEDPNDQKFFTGTPDEIAYKKLKVIVRALNEGTVLSYADPNQRKWYPWFEYSGSGFRFYVASYGYSFAYSSGGSRLCFHNEELAVFAGKKFIALYNQLLN